MTTEEQKKAALEALDFISDSFQTEGRWEARIDKDASYREAIRTIRAALAKKCEEVTRTCKGCGIDISHKHPNAKFHSPKCKDRYWNEVNPRGIGARYDDYDDDPSWDAHKSC